MKLILAIILVACTVIPAAAKTLPDQSPLPYFDWGACPFECCTYRKWQANASVTIYKSRSQSAEIAFQLKQGEWVSGVTGVVITNQFGISKILKPLELGYQPKGDKAQLSLTSGEIVYILHYLGE